MGFIWLCFVDWTSLSIKDLNSIKDLEFNYHHHELYYFFFILCFPSFMFSSLWLKNGRHYAQCGFGCNQTCCSKGEIYIIELWWSHNSQQPKLNMNPLLCGWKLVPKVPIFLNLKRVIEGGGSNNLTTMLVLHLLLGNYQILVWHPN